MSPDLLDEEIRTALWRVAVSRDVSLGADPVPEVESRVRSRRRRRRTLVGATALATAGLLATAAIALVSTRPDPSARVHVGTAARPTNGRTLSGVQVLDAGLLSPRINAAVVWTGSSLFVWGGNPPEIDLGRQLGDGATYDPETGQWTPLSTSPFPSPYGPPVAVATPEGVVVAQGRVVASWHSQSNTWTRLDDAPAPVTDLVWATGPVLSASANAALEVPTGRWTSFGERPAGFDDSRAVWTGTELVVLGQRSGGTPPTAAISPDDGRWRALPDAPNLVGNALGAAYDGKEVIVVDYDLHAAAYSPELERWRALPDVPAAFYEWYPKLHATAPTVTAFMGDALVIRGSDSSWIPVPYATIGLGSGRSPHGAPSAVNEGADGTVLVFGTSATSKNTLVRLRPDRVRATVDSVPLRSVTVHLDDGYRYVEGNVSRTRAGNTDGVSATIAGPRGRCIISSTTGPRAIRSSNGPWTRTGDQGWERELTGQEVLTIKCASSAAAESIRERIELP